VLSIVERCASLPATISAIPSRRILAAISGRVNVHADLSASFSCPSGDGQDDLGAVLLLIARVLVDGLPSNLGCRSWMWTELSSFMLPVGRCAGSVPSLGSTTAGWRFGCHRAGVTLRRGGAPRYEIDTQRILDLGDQGLTMTAVAAQVGMSVPGVWARYYRARPAERADASVSTAPVRMIPWQKVLAEALIEHEVIGVRAIAIAHLGHEPTRAQITAARRAAHRLVAADRAVYVPVRLGGAARQVSHLVLVRSDAEAGHDQVLDAATCKPPAAEQPARTLELSLTALGIAARNIDLDRLSAEQAGHLAAILQAAVAEFNRLGRRLERRDQRR
jgi:hypothetical protein